MTTFSFVWNIAYEATPAATDQVSQGDDQLRALKEGVRERMVVDHSWVGDPNDGQHLKVTLKPQLSNLPLDSTNGQLFSKNVGGIVELFYEDTAGNIVQITSAGTVL